jgi:predicted O-methyltransferase YrrM
MAEECNLSSPNLDISRALACNGWMSETELRFLAGAARSSKRIVEIGSWAGRSATAIASHTPGMLFCVDTWERALTHMNGAKLEPTLFNEFLTNTSGLPVVPVMMDSLTAAERFRKAGMVFDMIFIDASHEGPAVRADIEAWRPLLAEGAIFCGHDYGFAGWPDVKTVVDEMLGDVHVVDTIWWMEK